jgi:agmatinase
MGFHKKYPPFLVSEYPDGDDSALFHILPVPLERSVSYGGGTGKGPSAILRASAQLEVFDGRSCPGDKGLMTHPPVQCGGPIKKVLERIAAATEKILIQGGIPVLLGGEHTLSGGAFQALRHRYGEGNSDIGIVQIDAHADLRDSYEGSRFSHACVMKRALDQDFPIYQLGIRSLSPEEIQLRKDRNIPYRDGEDLCSGTPVSAVNLPEGFPQDIYLTIDVDGLDPSIIPGTGTPEPGGLGWYQTLNLIDSIAGKHRIIGYDVVELAPTSGSIISEFTTARLVYQVMGIITRHRDSSLDGIISEL